MGAFGTKAGEIDTLVLGCTHYPFAKPELQSLLGADVALVEPGLPVAKRLQQLLFERQLLNRQTKPGLQLIATGETLNLQTAVRVWLHQSLPVIRV
jgi:glutamate racemase